MSRLPCPACGSYNDERSLFCDQCGTGLQSPPRRTRSRAVLAVLAVPVAATGILLALLMAKRAGEHDGGSTGRGPSLVANVPDTRTKRPDVEPGAGGDGGEGREAGEPTLPAYAENGQEPQTGAGVSSRELPPWIEFEAVDGDGRATRSGVGAVLEGELAICPAEAFAGAAALRVAWGERRFKISSVAGWDLDRGFCLVALPEDSPAYSVGAVPAVGEELTVVGGRGKGAPCIVEDPRALGIEEVPWLIAVGGALGERATFLARVKDGATEGKELVGISWYSWPSRNVTLFAATAGVERQPELQISDWNVRIWSESAASLLARGRDAYLAKDYAQAARTLREALGKNEAFRPVLIGLAVESYLAWAAAFSSAGDLENARAVLLNGLAVAPDSKEILLTLAREEASLGLLGEALGHARSALLLDEALFQKRWQLLEDIYRRLAGTLSPEEAVKVLGEGVEELPQSAMLRLELGAIHFKGRRYDAAAAIWEEAYAISRDPEVAELIEEARRLAVQEDTVVVISIPEGAGTIRTPVTFARRLDVTCIIDTGATYTALPTWAAEALRIPLNEAKTVRIATASGVRDVPLVSIATVGLDKLEIGPVEVVILDLPHAAGSEAPGLLGLNFLRHFNVAIDKERRELRIAPR